MAKARLLQAIACAVLALAVLHPVTRADQAAMLQDAEADLVVQLDVVGARSIAIRRAYPAGNALVEKTTATLKSLTAKLVSSISTLLTMFADDRVGTRQRSGLQRGTNRKKQTQRLVTFIASSRH